MPHDPDPPPAKKFKPGSVFFRFDKNKPGMLLPKKENVTATPIDIQRKRLPIYQAKPQLLNQLRQLHSAVLIGEHLLKRLAFPAARVGFQCANHEKKSSPYLSSESRTTLVYLNLYECHCRHGDFKCLLLRLDTLQGRLARGRQLRSPSTCTRGASEDRGSLPSPSPDEWQPSPWQPGSQRRRGLSLANWYKTLPN